MNRFTTDIKQNTNKNKQKKNIEIAIAVLSAGVGQRIKSHEPRSMIKINDTSLIDIQISILGECFLKPEIIGVFGYDFQKICRKLSGKIRIIENQIHETTNTAESMRLAFNSTLKSSFMFLHGDLIFNKETLQDLDYSKSFVVIDTKGRMEDKEAGLTIVNNKATIFSYGLKSKWCQIAHITGKELKIAKQIFNKFELADKKMLSFEVLNRMISMGASFNCYEPQKMKIIEIDKIGNYANENFNI
jgi:choline kinase